MSAESPLDRLADLAGILPDYDDAWGARRTIGPATKVALLGALGIAADTKGAVQAATERLVCAPWRRALAPVAVRCRRPGAPVEIEITRPARDVDRAVDWRFDGEGGRSRTGSLRFGDLPVVGRRAVDGEDQERRIFRLPFPVTLGYHRFRLDGVAEAGAVSEMPLIVVPQRCHRGAAPGSRQWAFVLQLYALRTRHDWGIGDFTGLGQAARLGASLGADAIGVNPLHGLFPERPADASPYSPSHRQFLSVRYLDVEAVPDLAECAEAQRRIADPDFQARLAALRALPLVDHEGVMALKRPILELLYRSFRDRHLGPGTSDRAADFRRFQRARGESLERLGTFQALAERLSPAAWRDWPAGYRDPRSPEVAAFAAEQRERVEFFHYLQWLADRQLAAAAAAARDGGMAIGLYHDLALAPDGNGAEAWMNQRLLAQGATLGAPPDDWNLKGQNWGLPPYSPMALREAAFRPFIEVVRANLAHGGALRIDHVMGLERLFWIPAGFGPADGGYVRYPVDELFGILALESRRQKLLVIGEDLGTVSDGFRKRMRRAAVLSYRLLYFSRDARGRFLAPRAYPRAAAVAANTHDVAPLAGYWRGRDLDVRAALDLFPSDATKRAAYEQRAADRRALIRALEREGLVATGAATPDGDITVETVRAIFRFLARTPSRLLLVDVADVLAEIEQINVPGTVGEHPNWRRRLTLDVDALARDPRLIGLAAAIREERGGVADRRGRAGPS
jgi:4-alpha-glucanotransferase